MSRNPSHAPDGAGARADLPASRIPRLRTPQPHGAPDPVVSATPQTFVVTTTKDTGNGSFRKAIHDANANPGPDSIVFNISGGSLKIQPATYYEVVTSPVVIDGTTQPGYAGHPIVEFDGTLQTSQFPDFLEIDSKNVTVRGLVINNFQQNGIVIDSSGGDIIEGNYIGTDPSGGISLPNALIGIGISGPGNRIGGTQPGEGNVIQGSWQNIEIIGNDPGWIGYSHDNLIEGNIIGLDATGSKIISTAPQQAGGGAISALGSYNDTIGGTVPGARNIISGNLDGIYFGGYDHLQNTVPSYGNVVRGNFIGLDITGTAAPGNQGNGVTFYKSYNNIVGGTSSAARNVFANNHQAIRLRTPITAGNFIQGNYIGTDSSGTVPPSGATGNWDGIYSSYAHDNTIGGAGAGAGNIISGNQDDGIFLDTMSAKFVIQGNLIGVTTTGAATVPHGNGYHGIVVNWAPDNAIGGTSAGAGNTIGGNDFHGILVIGDSATGNVISGNSIGTDNLGLANLGNQGDGILFSASKNTAGGTVNGASNTIAYNHGVGIYILSGEGNRITRNSIYENTFLGIDIDPIGPNPNDSLDADGGPNAGQNYPVIDSVLRYASTTVIKGRLNSVPDNQFTIELYANPKGDTSGYGEGATYIGSTTETTDGAGNDKFTVIIPSVVDPKMVITATATDTAGNTSEFSKFPKEIMITRPAAGELWLTQEVDTIKWSLSGNVDFVGFQLSTDGGATFTGGYNLSDVPAADGQFIWNIPLGIRSKKCMISVWNIDHPERGDTSGIFKIKGYELTRDSAGQYAAYDPARHGWKFPNDAADIWPQSWYSQFNYLTGTDPATGIWYHTLIQVFGRDWNFPSWPTFVQAFGVNQCYFSTLIGVYKPSAIAKWLMIKGQWGGSCFGMGTASAMAFDDSSSFVAHYPAIPNFSQLIDLDTSAGTRNVINQLMTEQYGKQYQQYKENSLAKTPMMTLAELKSVLKGDAVSTQALRIGVPAGGHIVNPYKVETNPANSNEKWIYIYDNRMPSNQSLKIVVDSSANTWSYQGGLNWSGSDGMYLVDPASDYYILPTLGNIPMAGLSASAVRTAANPTQELYSTPGTPITIINSAGDSIGYANGHPFNNIGGAMPIVPETGGPYPPVGYSVPLNDAYAAVMSKYTDTTARFSAFTDSTIFTYMRSHVLPGESDRFLIQGGFQVTSTDPVQKRADIHSIIIHGDQERALRLGNVTTSAGDTVRVEVVTRQNLKVTTAVDSLRYDLEVEYAGTDGGILFRHSGVTLPPRAITEIVPAWDSMAFAPARILIDHTGGGTFDDTLVIDNESFDYYIDSLRLDSKTVTGGRTMNARAVLNKPAPHGGVRVILASGTPDSASVPPSVLVPAGQQSATFAIATQIISNPDSVVITGTAGGHVKSDTLVLTPQGVEFVKFTHGGGVFGGDTATCSIVLTNPAPAGGRLVTLTNSNPALVTVPPSVLIAEAQLSNSFAVQAGDVPALDSAVIVASQGKTTASGKLKVSSFAVFANAEDTVIAGHQASMVIALGIPAPRAIALTFRSSDSTVAPHTSAYIPKGATQATATAVAAGVDTDVVVTYTVTSDSHLVQHRLLVRPAGIQRFFHNANPGCQVGQRGHSELRVIAGNSIGVEVWLDGAPPPAGADMTLTSNPAFVVGTVHFTAHYQDSGFNVTLSDQVVTEQPVSLILSYKGKFVSDTLIVYPRLHYRIIDLGVQTSAALAVNNAGMVLGTGTNGYFFWKDGQTTLLSSYPGFSLTPAGTPGLMNDSGHIVGQWNGHAAYWKPDTTIVLAEPVGYSGSSGTAINIHDDVAGTAGAKGCVWQGGVAGILDDYMPGYHSHPSAINEKRQVVGGADSVYSYNTFSAALRWEGGHVNWSLQGWNVAYFDNVDPWATVINDSGIVAGDYYLNPGPYDPQGWFILHGADTINLPSLPPYYSMQPNGINASGVIVGNTWENDFGTYPFPFLYKDSVFFDLNCAIDSLPAGIHMATANAVNDRGVIVGTLRVDALNIRHGCILVPVGISVGVDDARDKRLPTEYKLHQNFPNPFNPVTTIRYDLPKQAHVSLKVYNILGQEVAVLIDKDQPAGYYSAPFNGSNLGSGVYFFRLTADAYTATMKMMLVK